MEASTTAQVRLGGAWRMGGAAGPLAGVAGLYLSPLLRSVSVESGNDSPEGGGWGELGQARNNGVVGIWGPKVQSSPLAQAVGLHTVGAGACSCVERQLGLHLSLLPHCATIGRCLPSLGLVPPFTLWREPLSFARLSLCKWESTVHNTVGTEVQVWV